MTEQMQSEMAELTGRVDECDDPRRSWAMVQERIRLYQLRGIDIPTELSRLERSLAVECRAASQGR